MHGWRPGGFTELVKILHVGTLNYNSNSNGWMFCNLKAYAGQSVLFLIYFHFSATIICNSINDKFSELTRRHKLKAHFKEFHCSLRYCVHHPLICGCPWSPPSGSSSGLCWTCEVRKLQHSPSS